jgi:hypothetical protein
MTHSNAEGLRPGEFYCIVAKFLPDNKKALP